MTRRRATYATTVVLVCIAAYVAVLLVLATVEAVGNVLEGDRYGTAAFLLLIALLVFGGSAVVTWFARRDGHSWWRAARRASFVLLAGTFAVAMIQVLVDGPF